MLPSLGEWNGIEFYTYPLMMGLAWGFAYQAGSTYYEKKWGRLFWNFFFWGTFLAAWLGAKLLFLLTNSKEDLLTNSNFWLGGGFVFYGGLLLALAYVAFLSLGLKKISWKELDALVPILCVAHGLGRLGCFLAGCCYGSYSEFFGHRHPVQIYEALMLFSLGLVFFKALKKNEKKGRLIAWYFCSYALLRFALEFFRGDAIRGSFGIFSTSQWVSLGLLILSLLLFWILREEKKYGT